ncbi:MAG TPA: hypothetical protein DCX07_10420, partial [Phycisphaerales bacterium]|nr:hypothetical protein [Phycisphaerales bacterium]
MIPTLPCLSPRFRQADCSPGLYPPARATSTPSRRRFRVRCTRPRRAVESRAAGGGLARNPCRKERFMTRWVARMLLPAALLLGGAGCAEPMIEVAKDKVYPALVFVKPIRETFEAGERQRAEVFGSGVIISADGLVVTNHHVAEKAIEVNCVLGDREQVLATVVGLDPETDLALLKLDLPPGHPPLTVACFGDSDVVEPGQPVLALGSPFGFTRSISQGIISNTKRYIGFTTQYQYNLWLQTDAAIN